MTNRQVFLMAIRAACIKAHGINSHRAYEIRSKINSPRLADVLLAIDCGAK
jgi:hypothetical protein